MAFRFTSIFVFLLAVSAWSKPIEQVTTPVFNYDVVLVPTDEFPPTGVAELAATVAKDTGLHIKAVLPVGTRDWKPYPDRSQSDPEVLTTLVMPAIGRLKANYGGKVYVILTCRDIGPPDKSFNFLFSQNDSARKISVVSAARMLFDKQGNQVSDKIIQTRLRKMILRAIALQYYELQRSVEINEVTYSPLMSVSDIDEMGLKLKTK